MFVHGSCLLFLLLCCSIHSGSANCPEGWTYYGGNCYVVLHEVVTWYEAKVACDVAHGQLVEIANEDQNIFVSNLLKTHRLPFAWLGLQDLVVEGKFVWSSNNHPPLYHNFFKGQPSDPGVKNEDCVSMHSTGQWYDDHCHAAAHSVVCQAAATSVGGPGDGIIG